MVWIPSPSLYPYWVYSKSYCYLNLSCCIYYRCIQGMDSKSELVPVLGVLQVLLLLEPFMLYILQVYTGYGFQVRACTRIGCTAGPTVT